MAEVREKRIELILQQLDELPTLPAVAIRVLQTAADDAASARKLAELISSDPSLTTRILQLLHRADSGVRSQITSIDRAVVLLGFEAVRSAVLAISVFRVFSDSHAQDGESKFDRDEFWKHSIAVACCAEALAEQAGVNVSDAFVCGLLHDLGKVALDTALPKSFSRVVEAADLLRGDIANVERSVIGLDHTVVGKRLAEMWRLPGVIRDAIWLHGQDPAALPLSVHNSKLVNIVTLADQIVRQQHLGYSGNYTYIPAREKLLAASGLSEPVVGAIAKNLIERIEPRARSLGLGNTSSNELFQEALSQANKELGRISSQLAAKNRRLQARAQFFEALSRFQAELRPDAAPQLVLQSIAQTAIDALDVPMVGAFSLAPAQRYAELVLCDGSGRMLDVSLIDLPSAFDSAGLVQPGEGPVLPTDERMEWLVSVASPRLAGDRRFWICLESEGRCIGGVIWGATTGESHRLGQQAQELLGIASGWALALRMAQIRDESKALAERLAEANRELQNAQSEILRGRTMACVGEMAAGAAHEMNNPLAVISGRSQLLAQQLSDEKLKTAATLVFEQSHRLSEIITELMDFARPEAPVIAPTDLAEVIDCAVRHAKGANDPADRSFEVTMGELPRAAVDAKQVSRALAEVIENAIHATDPKSGQIQLHVGFDPYSARLVVMVSDNGGGMDDATLKRAFDPFFSAKPAGRRRGLGLAKAHRWIEGNGGSIRLESRAGVGTRAIILLPADESALPASAAAQSREQAG